MKLPHAREAVVPKAKIADYLLSPTHPQGQDKAEFFGRFGFRRDEWSSLAHALRTHAMENEVMDAQDTQFGTRYTVEGLVETPDGRRPLVRAVWFIDLGAIVPRFVTAYPLGRSNE